VETSSPKLESYIQDHLISSLSELETRTEKDSSDSDLDPPSSHQLPIDQSTPSSSPAPTPTTSSSPTADLITATDIESEPLDVLFLVCVEGMLDTKAQLSDPISVTSPQMIQLYFQSNLQDSEAEYQWKIEKIILE
jgi:hypothetical protein